MRSIREIVGLFPGTLDTGLAAAQVAESQRQFGVNRLTPLPREPVWKKFLSKFDDAIIKILLAATLLKTIVDLFAVSVLLGASCLASIVIVLLTLALARLRVWIPTAMFILAILLVGSSVAAGHPSYEGLAVMLAVVLATGVAFFSEYKSDREFEILNTQKESLRSKVLRGGSITSLPMEDVVVGDRVFLETGDEIPADGRLVKAVELSIDQSLMTGESEAVRKFASAEDDSTDGPEQPGCVYRGTQVVDGRARWLCWPWAMTP